MDVVGIFGWLEVEVANGCVNVILPKIVSERPETLSMPTLRHTGLRMSSAQHAQQGISASTGFKWLSLQSQGNSCNLQIFNYV